MTQQKRYASLAKSLGLILILVGCGSDDLPEYFLLDRLRVIAVTMAGAAAEFGPGDAGLQAVFHLSDPLGAGRSLQYTITGCYEPAANYGKTTCVGNVTATTIGTGSFVPGSAATNFYGTVTSPAFAVPAAPIIFAGQSSANQYNGVPYLITATFVASATEQTSTFKRVMVSTKPVKNQNPAFSSPAILFNGLDATTATLGTTHFPTEAQVTAASREAYLSADSVGGFPSATEELTLTWMATAGEFNRSRTAVGEPNLYQPPVPRTSATSFIVVLRDNREGSAVVNINKP